MLLRSLVPRRCALHTCMPTQGRTPLWWVRSSSWYAACWRRRAQPALQQQQQHQEEGAREAKTWWTGCRWVAVTLLASRHAWVHRECEALRVCVHAAGVGQRPTAEPGGRDASGVANWGHATRRGGAGCARGGQSCCQARISGDVLQSARIWVGAGTRWPHVAFRSCAFCS